MSVKSSDRVLISRQFEIWCEANNARLCAQAMVAFLDTVDVFDDDKVRGYLKSVRKDNRSYTGIKKFEKGTGEPDKKKGKQK